MTAQPPGRPSKKDMTMTITSGHASNIEPSFSSGIPDRPASKARIWFDLILSLVLVGLLAGIITLLTLPVAHAQEKVELRIGYQKAASLFVLQKAQGTLEKRLQPLNATVKWVEFPAGPQLLE